MLFILGETIRPYQLGDQLGFGGMALVFKLKANCQIRSNKLQSSLT